MMLLAILFVVVRPATIFLANLGSRSITLREQAFLAALAPRGIVAAAVTSVFAIEFKHAADHGLLPASIAAQSAQLVPVVFLVIIGTVLVYGLLAAPFAQRLGLATKNASGVLFAGADTWTRLIAKALHADGHRVMLLDTNYANISAAKMLGLEAHRANILSEFAEEELDFNGLGSLIAGTPNDEVNSLATHRFIHHFGRAGVWQLSTHDRGKHHKTTTASDVRAQICFTGAPDHATLQQLAAGGHVVKKSQITDVFTLEDFHLTYEGQTPVILFIRDESKGLRPAPTEIERIPPGTTLYVLVPPPANGKDSPPST
jgi:hypothetical protein